MPLFSKDSDARAVGMDALIEGILDGRAHPDKLAPALIDLLQHPWLKLYRLDGTLALQLAIDFTHDVFRGLARSQFFDRILQFIGCPFNKPHVRIVWILFQQIASDVQ